MPHDISRANRALPWILVPAILLTPIAAQADWPDDPFGGNLPICTLAGMQDLPTVIPDGSGGSIIAWADGQVRAQKVDAAGTLQWAVDGVALGSSTGTHYYPCLIDDGSGGAIVAWVDLNGYNVYAQRVSATGVRQWGDGVALCTAANSQASVAITPDGSGGAIVAWQDNRTGDYDIYVQRVSAAGAVHWAANGVALCVASGYQQVPALISDGSGGAIVAWQDNRAASFDVYAQRVNAQGQVQWAVNGLPISVAPDWQVIPSIVTDGAGGAIIAWQDNRSSLGDIYAQRLSPGGLVQWLADGVGICTAAGHQSGPRLVADGAGGAIATWNDPRNGNNDLYAQRFNGRGIVHWPANGVAVTTASGEQAEPAIASDGLGGAIVAWTDDRAGTYDIYAQRISGMGIPVWAADGVALSAAAGNQMGPTITADGAGGAVVVWEDGRNLGTDIYAQAVDRFGYLGAAPPAIVSVRDVPNDQGGRLKVSWLPSHRDADPEYVVGAYWIWRSVPPNAAAKMLAGGAALIEPGGFAGVKEPRAGDILQGSVGETSIYWEYVGSSPATGSAGYSALISTTSDSLPGANPLTLVMIQARAATGPAFWDSPPDSGYSVDNLVPSAPVFIGSTHVPGATTLRWQPNAEADLAGYRLYRGATADFVPDAGNLVSAQSGIEYVDVGAPLWSYYKLSAVDIHGNESPVATLSPGQITGAGEASVPALTQLAGARPNPFNPATRIGFSLAEAGRVVVTVYDAAGRRVRVLLDEVMPAGNHEARWDGRADAGQAAGSGVYFCRMEAGTYRETRPMTLVR